jgi:hypothetical protein
VIVVGLHLLCRRLACEQKHHSHQNEHDSLHFHNSSFFELSIKRQARISSFIALRQLQFQPLIPLLHALPCRHVFLSFRGFFTDRLFTARLGHLAAARAAFLKQRIGASSDTTQLRNPAAKDVLCVSN